jgi:hypothetical protein
VKELLTTAILGILLAALSGAPAADRAPELHVHVWRVEFQESERADIDWEAVFADLVSPSEGGSGGRPRELPGRGKPLLAGTVPVTRRETVPVRSAAPPSQPRPPASSPRLSSHLVRHRDPAEVDHIVKQLTGQISEDPSHGTVTGPDVTREWRDPIRTVSDPETGQILETSLPRREPVGGGPVPGSPAAFSPPPGSAPPVVPDTLNLRTPLTPDLANAGPVSLASLEATLKVQGRVESVYSATRRLEKGRPTYFSLPYVHSREGGESFTVAVELGVVPESLTGDRWVLRLKPQFLTFEQAPRTIRLLAEGTVTLEPGEVVILSHILATEVAEAPSMFVKDPPVSRTLVLLSGLPAGDEPKADSRAGR